MTLGEEMKVLQPIQEIGVSLSGKRELHPFGGRLQRFRTLFLGFQRNDDDGADEG